MPKITKGQRGQKNDRWKRIGGILGKKKRKRIYLERKEEIARMKGTRKEM